MCDTRVTAVFHSKYNAINSYSLFKKANKF